MSAKILWDEESQLTLTGYRIRLFGNWVLGKLPELEDVWMNSMGVQRLAGYEAQEAFSCSSSSWLSTKKNLGLQSSGGWSWEAPLMASHWAGKRSPHWAPELPQCMTHASEWPHVLLIYVVSWELLGDEWRCWVTSQHLGPGCGIDSWYRDLRLWCINYFFL